ncbi:acetyl-CoA hydrolase/transferase C-terminal domain-containing protein [Maritimibacter sp. UBA3975]|uniref:acetyl-CoA hydrolase/transferase C-terminal domain-containing protein n=1 Tax=Maritimibacter sp. UBA3975 TaxID=1946833 RepID=UPI000C0B4040|nr:acetyl-CoA hydrolase/transferase C-terminal domain-containing protein [Maritimibacter sp. UBA3975]MAM60217.1 hypothetical protein [Maritimibacter sp.]
MADSPSDPDAIAAEIIARTGGDIRLALPLGLGKPVTLVNALTRAVAARPETRLTILTALTLEAPDMTEGMAARFLAPAATRLFGDYPALDYARMMRAGTLPDNIEVSEFFLLAGRWLGVPQMQRRYIAANYTHAYDVLRDWKPNVILQLFGEDADGTLSLSCNTDISTDLLRDRAEGTLDLLVAGEVNRNLPAFTNPEARVPREDVDLLYDGADFDLFSVVKRPVGAVEHAIGLHASRLIRDGGTIQIGIGAIGDAVAHALIARQNGRTGEIHNATPFAPDRTQAPREDGPFEEGLYAVTEMLVDGILQLFEAGIIRREVAGAAIHAGFFVDCHDFYARLRDLPEPDRAKIHMVPVSFTNQLYGDEAAKRAARKDARFVNAAMKATLLGGVVSDATAQGSEVSGVGGQFNFVEQAFALDDARSIITLPATRTRRGRTQSNIVWDHPHETVPRQYRDIIVTEYGIADLRGQRDEDVVARMLRITDSRFQDALLEDAKRAGKIARDFEIPAGWRVNLPDRVERWLAPFDLPTFPFGTDFDATERRILPALERLSQAQGSPGAMAGLILAGLVKSGADTAALARMDLDRPRNPRAVLEALALRGALARRD